ncbi:MAG: DUF3343 domain-containing protein, partial [Clostridiales bacterium]
MNTVCILVFDSTNHAIMAEKTLKNSFKPIVMPTPREITANCGLALKIIPCDLLDLRKGIKELNIPCRLYIVADNSQEGRQMAMAEEY